ncbi:leucine-rich repeat domain-containing protein [Streptomyces sp. CO7]
MTRSTPSGAPTGGTHDGDQPREELAPRSAELRAGPQTATPAEAGERVRELLRSAASGGGEEALRPAVRYSEASDCSTEELARLWAIADGDPFGFAADLPAPAYHARKAVSRLVALSAPGDGGHALRLAARFLPADRFASTFLLRMWWTSPDPDGLAEHLLAPAFRQEGRTELRLPYAPSLRGLRHLTMLEKLHLDTCGELTDLTEVGALTGLRDLDLGGCRSVEDLTPIGRLSRLTRLDLSRCGAVEDLAPLRHLGHLRHLTLNWTAVRSLGGLGPVLPALESLDLRFCGSLTDLEGLDELRNLAHLQLSDLDGLRDLSPFAALPQLRSLTLRNCGGLRSLEGLDGHPRLEKLGIHGSSELTGAKGLEGLPALREVTLTGCSSLADLRGLGGLPALRTLMINGSAVRELGDLSGSPLNKLTLLYMEGLESLDALRECPGLRELVLRDCPLVEGVPVRQLESLSLSGARWADTAGLAGLGGLRVLELRTSAPADVTPLTALRHLAELDLRGCRSLRDARPLLAMPSLTRIHLAEGSVFSASGALDPVVTELRARGVTVTLHP